MELQKYTKKVRVEGLTIIVTDPEWCPDEDTPNTIAATDPDVASWFSQWNIPLTVLEGIDEVTFVQHPSIVNECEFKDTNYCLDKPSIECFACGRHVCQNCSLLISYYDYGRQQLCHSCIIDYTNDETLVNQHHLQLAGY